MSTAVIATGLGCFVLTLRVNRVKHPSKGERWFDKQSLAVIYPGFNRKEQFVGFKFD